MRLGARGLSRLGLATALAMGGCGGSAPAPTPANDNAGSTSAGGPEPVPGGDPAGFEVHEWGVVDVPASGSTEVGAGPGQPGAIFDEHRPVRKPVLYFHVDPGGTPPTIDVSARIPGGSLIEHWPASSDWPATSISSDGVSWRGMSLGACVRPASVTRGPVAREATICAAPDGYCEVNDLPGYETADASCLQAGGFEARLLFYRGAVPTPALPLSVTRDPSGRYSLRASDPGGSAILFVRDGRGISLPWPAPGTDVGLPDAFSESLDGEALARSMASIVSAAGLTTDEADAFMRAWSEAFFQSRWSGPTRDLPERSARRLTQAPAPILLYVMPESTVSRVAELTITPAPRALRRVMVVRVELSR